MGELLKLAALLPRPVEFVVVCIALIIVGSTPIILKWISSDARRVRALTKLYKKNGFSPEEAVARAASLIYGSQPTDDPVPREPRSNRGALVRVLYWLASHIR